jgi:dipeptidyl aminopeptidase/acylaminoacyl peptidase
VLKKLLLGLSTIAVIATGTGLYLTRDTAPTHPVLKSSNLPPLISTQAFYADPRSAFGYVASNDGSLVAFQQASILGRSITVQEVATKKTIAEFPIGLSAYRWHPTKPLLRFLHNGDDWEADPTSPEPENWTRISPVSLSGWWIKQRYATDDALPTLVYGASSNHERPHLWHVSQDGASADIIAKGNPKTQSWVLDWTDKPVLRADSLDTATVGWFHNTGDDWEQLIDVNINDTFQPVSNVRADGTVLFRSSRGRDKVALVSFDIKTAEETVLIENRDADIGLTIALTYSGEPDLIRMGTNTHERVALTKRGQVFLDILTEFPQPITLGATASTASGRYVTQAISSQSKSFVYLLIDLQEQRYQVLSEYHFRRFKDHLVQPEVVTFTARDGLEIPAVLTMPKDVAGPIPFIVDIHGGPAGQVGPNYEHDTQFLVNRGYGVLSVNFRGSTGFGKEFQAKGYREFGRAMQDDIADAALWLVDQGMADTDALVAMGMSYGGYSAALAMTRDSGLFDAAILEFPLLDLEFQGKHHPGFWNNSLEYWSRYFGDIDVPEDVDKMRRFSPSDRVARLHGPILILGGQKDQITAIQQVRNFEADAHMAGKDVQVHYFPNAGHGTRHWRDQLRQARLREDFLAKTVGGRSGGYEFVEDAPAFID